MFNKKGIGIPIIGTVLIVVFIVTFIVLSGSQAPFEKNAIQKSGSSISLNNFIEIIRKMTEESLEVISKRTSYELGINGGGTIDWNQLTPAITTLEDNLILKIKENIPTGSVETSRKVTWGEGFINITSYTNYNFIVEGNKRISVYDKSIETTIDTNLIFNSTINSSYFKLLRAGRAILEDTTYYNLLLSNWTLLEAAIATDFNLGLSPVLTQDGDYVNITLADGSCLDINQSYCLAPLKKGEPSILSWYGKSIPYDFLKLNYRIYSPGLAGYIEVWAYQGATEVAANVTIIDEGYRRRGDINVDGKIDINDMIKITGRYGQTVPPAPVEVDLVRDGKIDINDVVKLTSNYGKRPPSYITYFKVAVEVGNVTLYAKLGTTTLSTWVMVPRGLVVPVIFNFP